MQEIKNSLQSKNQDEWVTFEEIHHVLDKAMQYEKALKAIAESNEDTSCNEIAIKYEVIAEKALYGNGEFNQ